MKACHIVIYSLWSLDHWTRGPGKFIHSDTNLEPSASISAWTPTNIKDYSLSPYLADNHVMSFRCHVTFKFITLTWKTKQELSILTYYSRSSYSLNTLASVLSEVFERSVYLVGSNFRRLENSGSVATVLQDVNRYCELWIWGILLRDQGTEARWTETKLIEHDTFKIIWGWSAVRTRVWLNAIRSS